MEAPQTEEVFWQKACLWFLKGKTKPAAHGLCQDDGPSTVCPANCCVVSVTPAPSPMLTAALVPTCTATDGCTVGLRTVGLARAFRRRRQHMFQQAGYCCYSSPHLWQHRWADGLAQCGDSASQHRWRRPRKCTCDSGPSHTASWVMDATMKMCVLSFQWVFSVMALFYMKITP